MIAEMATVANSRRLLIFGASYTLDLYRNKQHTALLCLLTGVKGFSTITVVTLAAIASSAGCSGGQASSSDETIRIDTNAPARPFPRIWEQMFGSGSAPYSVFGGELSPRSEGGKSTHRVRVRTLSWDLR